jgi:sugar fermentation stimulation protein A
MHGVAESGSEVWLSTSNNPKRKLPYTWEIVRADGALVGINPLNANRIVRTALDARSIPDLDQYGTVRSEVRYGNGSRIDFLLTEPELPDCYVEVKNVHLRRTAGLAEFPDAVTTRGAKHLAELTGEKAKGNRALMLFLVQREDCARFEVARDIDPAYDAALATALEAGVEVLCLACQVGLTDITIARRLDFGGSRRRVT